VTAYNVAGTIGGRDSRDSRQSVHVDDGKIVRRRSSGTIERDVVRVGEQKTRREAGSGWFVWSGDVCQCHEP